MGYKYFHDPENDGTYVFQNDVSYDQKKMEKYRELESTEKLTLLPIAESKYMSLNIKYDFYKHSTNMTIQLSTGSTLGRKYPQ